MPWEQTGFTMVMFHPFLKGTGAYPNFSLGFFPQGSEGEELENRDKLGKKVQLTQKAETFPGVL
jgi:hypothetical protein